MGCVDRFDREPDARSAGAQILGAARISDRPSHFGLFLRLFLRDFRPYLKEYVELAKPNFQYEKRQKELAKKKKQEEKRLKKLAAKAAAEPGAAPGADAAPGQAPEADQTKSGA